MELRRLTRFTLVELLVVIAIIGILAGLLLPTLSKAKKSGDRTQCAGNLSQIGKALEMYSQDAKGLLPLNCTSQKATDPSKVQLSSVLNPYLKSDKVFRCPDENEGLFAKEGSSYIWNWLQIDLPGNEKAGKEKYFASPYGSVPASGFPAMVDAGAYHGRSGDRGSLNVLFITWRVGTGKEIAF